MVVMFLMIRSKRSCYWWRVVANHGEVVCVRNLHRKTPQKIAKMKYGDEFCQYFEINDIVK